MPPEICSHHIELANKIAVMANDITYIRASVDKKDKKFEQHVQEAEEEGGHRDRIQALEKENGARIQEIATMKKERWKLALTVGAISAAGARSPDIWNLIVGFICKIAVAGQ